ncbi:MAG: cbb3-type cytochrome c oxidase subunit I [Gemmatimonadales bacterium]
MTNSPPEVQIVYEDSPPADVALADRVAADRSTRRPVLLFFHSAVIWLLVGSVFGLIASLKFQFPDWLTGEAAMTFGRVRSVHLNAVAYGWTGMALIGMAVWMIPRLVRAPLFAPKLAMAAAWGWNLFMLLGLSALLAGWTDGLEWLEIPRPIDAIVAISGGLMALSVLVTVARRRTQHFYVSVWYILAAMVGFPIIFVTANLPIFSGVNEAAVNWWYGHNALGLFITPIALAGGYYFIPKVLGRPIHSYNLSLVGFWSLAFFYSLNGHHHLIGGPMPQWVITTSITASVMMVIPVAATAVNFHYTVIGRFDALRHSPTLRFVVAGCMIYTVVSLQGSIEALRTVNQVVHFTQYTVGHAHFGVYGFASFILFGAYYFIVPRLVDWEWPSGRLIRWHFWLALGGIAIYVVSLSIGGWLQGEAMLDGTRPFMDSVNLTKPWLIGRTIGGTMMVAAHFVFAYHYWLIVNRKGARRVEPAWSDRRSYYVMKKPGEEA